MIAKIRTIITIIGVIFTISGQAHAEVFGHWRTLKLKAELTDHTEIGILNSENRIETFGMGAVRVDLTVLCTPPEIRGFAIMIDWVDNLRDVAPYAATMKFRLDSGPV